MTLPVLFGANVDPTWADPSYPVRLTKAVERAGLDLVTVQDHPYQQAFYDTWTLLAVLAAKTERIRLVPAVANLPLRPPAMLAKGAASLDLLCGGRLELGLGAGAFWDAIVAMGGQRRGGREAVDALDEAIEVIRLMWSGQRSVRFSGQHYRLTGVHPGPRPTHSIGIWLGAYGPRMLALTGAKADGWLPSLGFLGLDRLSEAVTRIDSAAQQVGRDPTAIRKVYNLNGIIGAESDQPFQGSVDQWTEQLVPLTRQYGMNGYVYWPNDDHERQISIFAEQVVPAARQALE